MNILMEKLYDNLDEAKAFALNFTHMIFTSDDKIFYDYYDVTCDKCETYSQKCDYISTKSYCRKPLGIIDWDGFGVCEELKNDLIANFDITEEDFRPMRNNSGKVIYYQITPRHTMLPNAKAMDWKYRTCPKCKAIRYSRDCEYNEKREQYYYISPEVLEDLHDLNVSYEHFECDSRLYVVSRRVYEYILARYPRTQFFPMFLKNNY